MGIPDYYVIGVTWLVGALVVLVAICTLLLLACIAMKAWTTEALKQTLMVMRLSTARYWVDRMETEGLTICSKEYRRMVAERKPKNTADFANLESDFHKAQTKGEA